MKKQAQNLSNSTKNRKTGRLALFSENERQYLKGKQEYNKVMKSKFHKRLDHRFNALIEDLEIMHSSSKLQLWKKIRSFKYDQHFKQVDYFSNLFPHVEGFYSNALRQIKIKKVYKYWQDNTPLDDSRIDKKSLHPDHFFRHCRSLLNESNDEKSSMKKTLLEAFKHQGILPTEKEEAITFKEINDRLRNKSKIRSNIKENIDLESLSDKDREQYLRIKGLEKLIQRKIKLLRNDAKRKYDITLQLSYGYVL